jgi:hypothetical protein
MAVYKVGSSNDIDIRVFVDTEGISGSTVFQKRGSASKVRIAQSELDSGGNIPRLTIGNSMSLINSLIIIITNINLSLIDEGSLESVIEDTEVNYTFFGGPLGEENIDVITEDIIVSDNKRVITFVKIIDMIF